MTISHFPFKQLFQKHASYTFAAQAIRLLSCFAFVVACVHSSVAQQARVAPEDDMQSWNEVQLTIPVNKRLDLVLNGIVRFGDDVSEFVYERAGVALGFKAGKYLTLTPSYSYIATQQPETRRKGYENRPGFAAMIRLPQLEKVTITDRNLVERRIFNSRPDTTSYRNRMHAERPFSLGSLGAVRLFIADEVFYDTTPRAWTRNRFTIGGGRALNKNSALEIYYLRQNDKRSRPGDLHVIGTTLRFRL